MQKKSSESAGRSEARERFVEEATASWLAYQETGKHLTGQEVREWLRTWGTEKEKPVPKCRTSLSKYKNTSTR